MTAPLREHATPALQNDLFLVRHYAMPRKLDVSGEKPVQAKRMGLDHVSTWYDDIKRALCIAVGGAVAVSESHIPQYLNLVRFRSTMADRLVREGVDFFAVQAILGHRKAATTASYLRSHLLAGALRAELDTHLQKIHRNMAELAADPKPYATPENVEQLGQNGVIYKGILCDCKNAYAPPEKIRNLLKRAGNWEDGKPCAYYDMCLLCDNLLVTRRSLPLVVQYQREIEASNVPGTPAAKLYLRKTAVLDDIRNYFSAEDMAWAEEVALEGQVMIDPLTYKGTELTNSAIAMPSAMKK